LRCFHPYDLWLESCLGLEWTLLRPIYEQNIFWIHHYKVQLFYNLVLCFVALRLVQYLSYAS
jgi:hypothetical protein